MDVPVTPRRRPAEGHPPLPDPAARSATILVVEDNEMNLELMVYLLRAFGYAPILATDGETGLETARRERPDLILCDLQMPGVDGLEFARIVRHDHTLAAIPLIAVTALATVGDKEKFLSGGFDGYISKPINPETFVREIEELLPAALRARRGWDRHAP